jgi:hypothetical protein
MPVLTKINRNSLAAGVVGTTELADNAVTSAKAIALDTADITTGTFANARLSESSVTQHSDSSIIVGKTAQSLTGTIATSSAYYGVNFTCTGNLTINLNTTLLIGRMLKDQSAVSLTHTASTAVTITGTGTLVYGTGILIQPTV